jgi:hypothetical protein
MNAYGKQRIISQRNKYDGQRKESFNFENDLPGFCKLSYDKSRFAA